MLVFILEIFFNINAAEAGLLDNVTNVPAFNTALSIVINTGITEVTYTVYAELLASFSTFFEASLTETVNAAVTIVNTEVNFNNFIALSEVSWGKFCAGFIANEATFLDTFECICADTFVGTEADGIVTCACGEDQSQVNGVCTSEAEVAALVQTVQVSGAITTAYEYSSELTDTSSAMFISHASAVERDLVTVMSRSVKVTTVVLKVTGFTEVVASRKRRQAGDAIGSKAKAQFEGEATVPADESADSVESDVADTIAAATDDGFESLDTDSFKDAEFDAEVPEVIPDPTPAATESTEDSDYELALKIFFPIICILALIGIIVVALKCQANPKMMAILLGTVMLDHTNLF